MVAGDIGIEPREHLGSTFHRTKLMFRTGSRDGAPEKIQDYNMAVEYSKYTCILEAFDHPVLEPFEAIIREEFKQNKAYLVRRLEEMKALNGAKYQVKTLYNVITCDYGKALKQL